MIFPIVFNLFNVRRYGEIEFWFTVLKIAAVIGITILGILLPMNVSTYPRLLGTNAQHQMIPCNSPATDNCVNPPGFDCMFYRFQNMLMQIGEKAHSKNTWLAELGVGLQDSGYVAVMLHIPTLEPRYSVLLLMKLSVRGRPCQEQFIVRAVDWFIIMLGQP